VEEEEAKFTVNTFSNKNKNKTKTYSRRSRRRRKWWESSMLGSWVYKRNKRRLNKIHYYLVDPLIS